MNCRKTFALGLALSLILGSGQILAQTANEQFAKATQLEEVKGELEKAIEVYQAIVTGFPENRQIAAKAQFHIGLCYEKLGLKQAQKAYREVVNNYPGQKNEVALAKKRLSQLILLAEKISKAPLVPKFTKIQIPVKLARGAQLSPDGKTLTFSSTMYEGSIWTVPIHGKVGPNIAGKPEKLIGEDKVWAWGHVWSADGKWIAYNYMKNDKEKDIFVDEVHVINSTGGEPTKIALPVNRGGSYNLFQYSLSLSPDGKVLAYASKEEEKSDKPKESYIYTIPVNGGVARRLTDGKTWLPAFSPDNKKIAYIKKSSKEDELWVVPSLGGTPVKVCDLGGEVWGPPIWSPESDMIAFLRETKPDEKCKEIWLVPLSETGSSTALPIKIELLLESSMNLAGWTGDNKVGLLMLSPVQQAIYTIPSSGGKATQITPAGGQPFCSSWNNNGQRIYFTDKGNLSSVASEGGEISSIPVAGIEGVNFPVVSPDGKKVLFHGFKKGVSGMHIWTVSIEGGEPTQVIQGPFEDNFIEDAFPRWSPDGKTICFWRHEKTPDGNGVKSSLCMVPYGGGDIKVLISDPDSLMKEIDPRSMRWSPDGKSIVYYFNEDGKIKTIPLDNGEPQVLAELHKEIGHTWMAFSPDGKKILYTANNKIWTISLGGAEPVEIKTGLDTQPFSLAWSPDGKRIAFTTRKGGDIELWLMENFLPLEKLPKKSEKEDKEFNIRRVSPDTKLDFLGDNSFIGETSPDGKYLSYTDWKTGNLAIYEITTRKKYILTNEGSINFLSPKFANNSRWSPNSKQIVYDWFNKGIIELRIIGLNGTKPRVLYRNKDVVWAQTCDWSADGTKILAGFWREDGPIQIVLVSTEDGSVRILKTLKKKLPRNFEFSMKLSPDGRYIVYDLPQKSYTHTFTERDIFLLSTNGEPEITLCENPADDHILGWAPNGKRILFASDRRGSLDAWSIHISDGKPQGAPELVKLDIGQRFRSLGFTQEGSFYYGIEGAQDNEIYIAKLDPATGKSIAPPKSPITRFKGNNWLPDYSPDGKYIAYVTGKRNLPHNLLIIHNLETGEERELATNIHFITKHIWSPDCSSILFRGTDEHHSAGIYQIDIQTGTVTNVVPKSSDTNLQVMQWSDDGKSFYMIQTLNSNKTLQIVVREIESRTEKELYRASYPKNANHILYSPDGKWLSSIIREGKELKIMSAAGGESRVLYKCEQKGENVNGFRWSPDGEYIFYVLDQPKQNQFSIWRIPREGGETQKVLEMNKWETQKVLEMNKLFHKNIKKLSVHPDGQHVAFQSTSPFGDTEVWLMENFLPKTETKK